MLQRYSIWQEITGKQLLIIALSLVLITHGIIIYYTLPKTYDAFVHMFFADHYARFWFEPWEYRWYTGFLTTSYPPLVHQAIALLNGIFPLKVAFCIYAIVMYELFVLGIYRFTKIFYSKTIAGIAAILAVVLSSLVETLHVYGQVPTITGLAFLLNALPFLYQYMVKRKGIYLLMTLSFLAVVASSHHVTVIFGMVFFIAPTIFMALTDSMKVKALSIHFPGFIYEVIKAALRNKKMIILFVGLTIFITIGLIFPYWYWSKTDPITQVSIPHGSRDNFLENYSSGLIFYIIPLILIFALLPAISYSITKKRRYFAWAISFFLCLLLGSGGTTPLPKMMLGETAFNILTLDRFGLWASIIAIPFMAKFIHSLIVGSVRKFWVGNFGARNHFILTGLSGFSYLLFLVFVFHLASFRPLQPKEIDVLPIQNFLSRDDHMRWRYLTLGFGDQMAWLSANSLAATVDGNYHSARRLPELTSRPVERLENAKFKGEEGIASLSDFLTYSEKYNLKYIFSNDRYYDPLLYYTGWNRTIRLENGIMVWEKANISTIKPITPKKLHPILKYMWGIFPTASLIITIMLSLIYINKFKEKSYSYNRSFDDHDSYPLGITYSSSLLPLLFSSLFMINQVYELLLINKQKDPINCVINHYNDLDFQHFEEAFTYFNPTPAYTLDQYLLEKSVNDGGLLPSYAKLDSISAKEIKTTANSSLVKVYTRWNTALGYQEKTDSLQLVKNDDKWYIQPAKFEAEIPDEQVRSYTFTIFKKQGKRVISSFPTVKDDRVNKPLVEFRQVHLIKSKKKYYLTGEIANIDAIPASVALEARVLFPKDSAAHFVPSTLFHHNLSPKSNSYFQIDLNKIKDEDVKSIKGVKIYAKTDVSEKGYIHGGSPAYSVKALSHEELKLSTKYYNELTVDINIPGLLIAEKDERGRIWQVQLYKHPKSLRSGLNVSFDINIFKIQHNASIEDDVPIQTFINGKQQNALPLKIDKMANQNLGIVMLPHCFIAQEIYLQ